MNDDISTINTPSIDFPYAYGVPLTTADFRSQQEDFVVDEELDFLPDGEGEHLLVQLRKRGDNTAWIAELLAKHFNLRQMDVGFCGLKDRHAVTSQWFSLYLPKAAPSEDAPQLQQFLDSSESSLELLAQGRHRKKLRRGQHKANHFRITLKNLANTVGLEERLQQIAENGVPNYFGEQRFGRYSSNLHWAMRWFEQGETIRNRNKKVMAKSAARAYLFNLVLAKRVEQESWSQLLDDNPESATGPLWGRGRPVVAPGLAELEGSVLSAWQKWLEALEHVGLQQERRALVLKPEGFNWQMSDEMLVLEFALPPGAFATSVLRELALLNNISAQPESVDA